jgi:AraC family transcriptional regulator, transcriptional activator of pobA
MLSVFRPDFETEFPFFDLTHTNFFSIRSYHFDTFAPLLEDVFSAYQRFPQPGQPPVAALKLLAVLYQFRSFVADLDQYQQRFVSPEKRLFSQYVQLVNNYYLDKRTVEEYAQLLNITAHHLSESVKLATNHNALQVINQKLLAEAKIMLRYTQSDIAEVAYGLNFSDPANFGRFFKKLTGQTPLEYRRGSA